MSHLEGIKREKRNQRGQRSRGVARCGTLGTAGDVSAGGEKGGGYGREEMEVAQEAGVRSRRSLSFRL